ncbi:hypothetical protein ACLOAU_11230 [Niabella sp. CJ426]|jgi:hypothetical protein|uniref:hypothetical protein n=1 Tax=Niabella sp. CJ426 TaxID=3393740 RepID=UPI003D001E63
MRVRKFFERLFNWELWNFHILYAPIAPVWLWYCIKSRSLWFFTPSNPNITFGGFEGEGKKEMYQLLPAEITPQTIYVKPGISFHDLKKRVDASGIRYPFVVKPDVGMKGILFRVIEDDAQLKKYHAHIPFKYIIQEKIDFPVEVSVFYYRYPWQSTGVVSGFIYKELLQVTGDGKSTLKQLINQHERARYRFEEMELKHGHDFDKILETGEVFYLSFAGNHNRGARFTNLHHEINPALVAVFDKLSQDTQFYYGRYDIKTNSIEDLKNGKHFIVLEYNGAGAEPNHIYDCGMSLGKAYKTILQHWRALYEISRYNAKQGHAYWSYRRGKKYLRAAKHHFRILEKFDE